MRLNGQSLGVVWTAPWSVDLTGLAKAGKNELEIDVSNTWVNRLVGDARIPDEAQRLTKTNARRDPNYKGPPCPIAGLSGHGSADALRLARSRAVGVWPATGRAVLKPVPPLHDLPENEKAASHFLTFPTAARTLRGWSAQYGLAFPIISIKKRHLR